MDTCFAVQAPSKEAAVFLMTSCMSKEVLSKSSSFVSNSFRVSRSCVRSVSRSVSNKMIFRYFSCRFRRNCSVCHCLYISFDGGERRTKIVGDICHELFLVILHIL